MQGSISAICIVGAYMVLASCCITYTFSKIVKERLEKEKLIYTSNTDELTRCLNRHAYENDINTLKICDEWVYILMLSRLVDTFFSRTSWTMLLYAENHSISVA